MRTIELSVIDGKLLSFVDYELDLVLSPPEIRETFVENSDTLISENNGKLELKYKNISLDEGRLKIFVCDFSTGKSCIYLYGKLKGKEIKCVKEFTASNVSASVKNIKIKYVLVHSRNILRNYYLSSDTKSIEKHLTTFLTTI